MTEPGANLAATQRTKGRRKVTEDRPDQEVLVEELEPGIVLITLNRAQELELNDLRTRTEHAIAALGRNPLCRVVIITGASRGFSSGHELSEFGDEWTAREGLRVQEAFTDLISTSSPSRSR